MIYELLYWLGVTFVGAAVITFPFIYGILRMGSIMSRQEEATIDQAALEGDLTAYVSSLNKEKTK